MRRARRLRDGARYHVTGRINRREACLESSTIKEIFLKVLREAKKKYSFQIENFCIMGNHYHLVILPAIGQNLSDIMRWIMGVFAIRYNKLMGLSGHVWGDRFFSRIIEGFQDYLRTFIYICNNPIEAGCISGPCHEWKYGGACHYRDKRDDILGILEEWILVVYEYITN